MNGHDLCTALDQAAKIITAESPELTEDQVTIRVLKLNIYAAAMQLAKFLDLGQDMDQVSLNGFCQGLTETIIWIASKEESGSKEMDSIEKAANDGQS